MGRGCSNGVAVAAFREGREADELRTGPDGGGKLGTADAQTRRRVALQGAQAENLQLVADLIDPESLLAGKEAALGHEERGERRAPRSRPLLLRDGGFGSVDGDCGGV